MRATYIARHHDRLLRWQVVYPGEGMDTHTLHFTRLGARLSRWWNAAV